MRRSVAVPLALEAIIMVGAYMAYEAVRRLVVSEPHLAFGNALDIIHIERRLGIFYEPDLQRLIVGHDWLVTLFNWIYVWGYLPVIIVAAIYLFLAHRTSYMRYRNTFLLSGAVGLAVFAVVPVAPPRMFPELGFVDTVHLNSEFYRNLHSTGLVNEFAAVPSFHFGWILLIGLALWQTHRHIAMRAVAVALPLAMLSAIVFTANHYVLDAAAGAALVLGALGVILVGERNWPRLRARLLPLSRHVR